MSKQHTALLVPGPGVAFEVGKRNTPTPGPSQILIRNKAVALNPVDVLMQKTGFMIDPNGFPAVLGRDGAGEIVALGTDVTGWKLGDKVFYQSSFESDRGSFQELTIADAAYVAKIPSGLSYEKVVSVPLTFATAAIGAYKARSELLRPDGHDVGGAGLIPPWEAGGLGKYAGQAALILGGSSSVGQFALQLAKLSGFSIIITTASKHNETYVKDAGATHFIDYKDASYAELPEVVKKIVGDTPLTYVYDAVARGGSQEAGWEALSPGGALVVVLPPSPTIGTPGKDDEKGRRVVAVHGSVNDAEHREFGKGLYANISDLLEKGEIKPNKVEVIGDGLDVIPSGLDKLAKGVSGVKLVATL